MFFGCLIWKFGGQICWSSKNSRFTETIKNPVIKVQNQKAKTHKNPTPKIQISKVQNPEVSCNDKAKEPKQQIYRKETTSQTSKIQKHKLKPQNQNDKIQFPKSKIQIPKSKLQSPNLKIQNPRSKLQSPNHKNQTFLWISWISWVSCSGWTHWFGPHVLDELIDSDLMFLWTTSRGLKWKSKGSTSKNPKC